jgi:hypothetical protein
MNRSVLEPYVVMDRSVLEALSVLNSTDKAWPNVMPRSCLCVQTYSLTMHVYIYIHIT